MHTFHGRDLFAFCGAKLASGKITFAEVGTEYPIEEIVQHKIQTAEVSEYYVKAVIQSYDPFGSAELSVLNCDFQKTGFKIGENVLFNDLASFVTIGSNQGNFKKKYNLASEKVYVVGICECCTKII